MDHCKEQQEAMKANVTLDVSSPKAKEKEHLVKKTPDYKVRKPMDLEPQSPLMLTLVRKTLNGIHIDSNNDDCSPQTPKDVFDPFAPGSEDMVRAPLSRKYHEEESKHAARKLHFYSSTHHSESVSDKKH
ncbi:unnamed protein product [Trifolium pratense]|uniref:Uncharacterized protein n=1 Tax=Trifolium pratense TaxID=57577 RepID=A0ACB0JLW4_TRIPR|nr:unnamed protein product [Trifolium pratense]